MATNTEIQAEIDRRWPDDGWLVGGKGITWFLIEEILELKSEIELLKGGAL
jgi:hypothetical protein